MLLATDLDGTFLAGRAESRTALYRLISRAPDIKLAYFTGRGLETVLPLMMDPTIPTPDYIVCDVGATVVEGTDCLPVQPLQTEIDKLWPGEQAVMAAFQDLPGLVRQEVPQQRRCSYYCGPDAVTEEVHRRAQELGCEALYSADRYLDILPRGVNKGSTLKMLVSHLGTNPSQVLVAGDTLNDLAMMQAGYNAVCVGNSEKRLVEATAQLPNVYRAEASGCGGILEALAHFEFLGPKGIDIDISDHNKPGRAELVMVYHRLPYEEVLVNGKIERRRPTSPNGIIPTLLSFFSKGEAGSWVAWSINVPKSGEFESTTTVDSKRYRNLVAARVPLTKRQVDIFYKVFSKEAFWPLLHTFWERATFNENHWKVFLEVNRIFAERTAHEAAEGATVWIHDYNLWMVPAYLREMRPDVVIAFFHHTYFPSSDIFNILPWRRQIIASLLHCDYIGFHIPRQVENFVDVVRSSMPVSVLERVQCAPRFLTYGCAIGLDEMTSKISAGGRVVRMGAHPVGTDIDRVRAALDMPDTKTMAESLRKELNGRRMVLSVERLDYTKGILAKLQAFERLLQNHPELHGKVELMVVCVPAAAEMSVYRSLQNAIEQAVGRINGRFSTFDWTPLRFFFRGLPFHEVVAYYSVADVMWITPLRDGLNLVAKEYVAAHGLIDGRGVLVLSEFAGSAAELKGAILTNPHDARDLYENVHRGITLGEDEAEARMRELYDIVCHYDIGHWGEDFLGAVHADDIAKADPGAA